MKDLRPPTCSAHSTPIQPRTPTRRAPTPENYTENRTTGVHAKEAHTHTHTHTRSKRRNSLFIDTLVFAPTPVSTAMALYVYVYEQQLVERQRKEGKIEWKSWFAASLFLWTRARARGWKKRGRRGDVEQHPREWCALILRLMYSSALFSFAEYRHFLSYHHHSSYIIQHPRTHAYTHTVPRETHGHT